MVILLGKNSIQNIGSVMPCLLWVQVRHVWVAQWLSPPAGPQPARGQRLSGRRQGIRAQEEEGNVIVSQDLVVHVGSYPAAFSRS